jgi:hypothetical protein
MGGTIRIGRVVGILATFLAPGTIAQTATLDLASTGEIGTPAIVTITGLPAGPFALLLDGDPGPTVVPGVGTLLVGLSPSLAVLNGVLPFPAQVSFAFPIPNSPPLVGNMVYLQAGGLEASTGTFVLSNGASLPIDWAPITIVENFDTNSKEDAPRTGAFWNDPSGGGVLRRGNGGGSGLLGDLAPSANVTFDTTSASFPASQTLTGQPFQVTNGIFEFARLHIPTGVTVRFEGSLAARIFARGEARIEGTLELSGENAPDHFDRNDAAMPGFPQAPLGGLGGAGGPGAGAGGKGADIPLAPNCPPGPELDGEDGVGVGGVGGPANGAGGGSVHWPPNLPCIANLPGDICPAAVICLSEQRSRGGGGGGFLTAGNVGLATGFVFPPACSAMIPWASPFPTPGGPATPVDPSLDPATGNLKGGSGGGGSGAHPKDSRGVTVFPIGCNGNIVPANTVVYHSGGGGGGGGGAGQFQAGRLFEFAGSGLLEARGGDGASSTDAMGVTGVGAVSGGGGGSGGAALLQAGRGPSSLPSSIVPRVDVLGGFGGTSQTGGIGGSGGSGYVRVETDPPPTGANFANFALPSASLTAGSYLATSQHPVSGAQSLYYDTTQPNPRYLRYELEVSFRDPANPNPNPDPQDPTQTIHVVYDDDPSTPNQPPVAGVDPVAIVWQGSAADPSGNPMGTPTLWSPSLAALTLTNSRLARFTVLFDRDLAAALDLLAVTDVRIVYKP